jgi:hypothetical protein
VRCAPAGDSARQPAVPEHADSGRLAPEYAAANNNTAGISTMKAFRADVSGDGDLDEFVGVAARGEVDRPDAHLCSLKRPLINATVPLPAPATLHTWSSFAVTTQLRPRFLARYNA